MTSFAIWLYNNSHLQLFIITAFCLLRCKHGGSGLVFQFMIAAVGLTSSIFGAAMVLRVLVCYSVGTAHSICVCYGHKRVRSLMEEYLVGYFF